MSTNPPPYGRDAPPARHKRGRQWSLPWVLAGVVISVATLAAFGLWVTTGGDTEPAASIDDPGGRGAGSPDASASMTPEPEPQTVSISATGDTVIGSLPSMLPPEGPEGFFDDVADELSGDLVIGNLEGVLSERTDFEKCAPDAGCVYIRMPPSYAQEFADAGFDVLNIANNHGWDSGPQGAEDTRVALNDVGVQMAGMQGEIVEVEVNGLTVAVVGFAVYDFYTNLLDLDAVEALVRAADEGADLVVVTAHLGAEGTDARHVEPGPEDYLGEPRGDSVAFAHTAVDAGADLVIGHGPHVLRGMEFYNGRLIAHSLGNFSGYQIFNTDGWLGIAGILQVELDAEGEWVSGRFVDTAMVNDGYPTVTDDGSGRDAINELASDFGDAGVTVADDGGIVLPR